MGVGGGGGHQREGAGEGNEDIKMKLVSDQWEMVQLSKYELSRQRCKAAGGVERGGGSATQWSHISVSEALIDTSKHKNISTLSSFLRKTPLGCVWVWVSVWV